MKLSWTSATDHAGVTGYRIYVDGKEFTTVSGNVYGTTVNGLTADTKYAFKVTAYDAVGNESEPISKQRQPNLRVEAEVPQAAVLETVVPKQAACYPATPI
ncbi:fibronectin type III domain-containing protein [Paenibacillus azoreducens]|uniref:Fibronectin type-III domain-containing protein n=1 Tax=Paenibacillus azoreducens TaxID=116718 RepID=A0A920CMT1_9BACL|nr:fibronectin type III domain-containing protein [Paenibacillus azoreducens]GIO46676.1 hypothetical protein J34TS1_14410 [Paenibacillus azoreducens]